MKLFYMRMYIYIYIDNNNDNFIVLNVVIVHDIHHYSTSVDVAETFLNISFLGTIKVFDNDDNSNNDDNDNENDKSNNNGNDNCNDDSLHPP